VLGGAAAVLASLVVEVAVIGIRVGEVARGREVDRGLDDLAESGRQSEREEHDQQEPHRLHFIPTRRGDRKAARPRRRRGRPGAREEAGA